MIYSALMISPNPRAEEKNSVYVENDRMLQRSRSRRLSIKRLQERLDLRLITALPLGLSYSPAKAELIHLHPTSSNRLPTQRTSLRLGAHVITNSTSIQLLWITIDQKLTFREQISISVSKVRSLLLYIQRMAFTRGASMTSLHHLATTLLIPTILWGSEVSWTGARHIVDNITTTNHRIARLITNLPLWTRRARLIASAGLPPLNLLLNHTFRKYAIRLLSTDNDPPNQIALRSQPGSKERVGLGRIKHLLLEIIPQGTRMKHDKCPDTPHKPIKIHIDKTDKNAATTVHRGWLKQLQSGHLLYTDGSRNNINSSGWCIMVKNGPSFKTIYERHCNIGRYEDILQAEIHAIREGSAWILTNSSPQTLHICVDNQQALRSLGGGMCRVKEDLKECLDEITTLQQAGCTVKGQWTPSHEGIPGNERADKLRNQRQTDPPCPHSKCTITWTSIKSKNHLMPEWAKGSPNPPYPIARKVNSHIGLLPRYQAAGILRLKCKTTNHDECYNNPSPICTCGHRASSEQTLLRCPHWTSERLELAESGPLTWDHLTNAHPTNLNKFIRAMGMTNKEHTKNFRESI